jgi:delta24(24(1))-sterol reductase
MQGITKIRNTFPQLPWSIVKEPKFIQTAHGYVFLLHQHFQEFLALIHHTPLNSNRLLTNGWWAYARKIVSYAFLLEGDGWLN